MEHNKVYKLKHEILSQMLLLNRVEGYVINSIEYDAILDSYYSDNVNVLNHCIDYLKNQIEVAKLMKKAA